MPVPLEDTDEAGFFRFMFWGINGTGKTTLAHRLAEKMVLRIVTDSGGVSLHGYEDGRLARQSKTFRRTRDLRELSELAKDLANDDPAYADFDTIVFDNVSAFQRDIVSRLIRNVTWSQKGTVRTNRVLGDTKDKTLGNIVENAGNDDYMWTANSFRLIVNTLIAAPKNVIFIAQKKELGKQDQDRSVRPDLSEGNENSIGHVVQASGWTKTTDTDYYIDFRQVHMSPKEGKVDTHAKSWINGLTNQIVTHDKFIEIVKAWQKGKQQ